MFTPGPPVASRLFGLLLAGAFLQALLLGCHSNSARPAGPAAPQIEAISPLFGPAGTRVTLAGSNLQSAEQVLFAPEQRAAFSAGRDGGELTVTVPEGARSGPIQVLSGLGSASFPLHFLVTTAQANPPQVLHFAPDSGTAYAPVAVRGSGFTGADRVTVGGVAATQFSLISDQELRFAVPPGAPSGPIAITAQSGTGASADSFRVGGADPAPPVARTLAPASGPWGTAVELTGDGFYSVTAATLSGQPLTFHVLDDSQLTLLIPSGASSGPILLTGATGAQGQSPAFTVVNGPVPVPTITSFSPASGRPGTRIVVTGTHLQAVEEAYLGTEQLRLNYSSWDGLEVDLIVTDDARTGRLRLTYPGGETTFLTPFQVLAAPPPTITEVQPRFGPEGTPVTFSGENFGQLSAVLFGTTPATTILDAGSDRLTALVPAGAQSGPVTVRTANGEYRTRLISFQVLPGPVTMDLRIEALYLTQGTQRLDQSVPLLAGRPGRLRVFPTSNWINGFQPRIEVAVLNAAGNPVRSEVLTPPGGGVPVRVDEADPLGSWDLDLPGELIQPGAGVRARILAEPGLPELDPAGSRFPADGSALALTVRSVAPIAITLIPVAQGGTVGTVASPERPPEAWLKTAKQLFPLQTIDLRVGPTFVWDEPIVRDSEAAYNRLLAALEAARLAADPGNRRYHVGACALPAGSTLLGIGLPGATDSNLGRASMCWDGTGLTTPEDFSDYFAHELGHNFGRYHAPCGVRAALDPDYPYPGGRIGVAGFDLAAGRPLDPWLTADLMSYCRPRWISDYTFLGAMAARDWELRTPEPTPAGPGLLVWGEVLGGTVHLEPAFEVTGVSSPPPPGPYTLVCRDAAGAVLREIPFAPGVIEDQPGSGAFGFVLALPQGLASLEVLGPGEPAPVRPVLARAKAAPLGLPRQPVATSLGSGVVHLSWDAGSHPMALVKDPASGAVLGLVHCGSADFRTGARELEVNLSAGPRSVRTLLQVRP